MEEVLKIKVGADISEFVSAMDQIAAKTSKSTGEISNAAEEASNSLDELGASATSAGNKTKGAGFEGAAKAMGTLSLATEKTSFVLTQLGQAAQKTTLIKIGDDLIKVTKPVKELTEDFRKLEKRLAGASGAELKNLNAELDRLATIIQRVKAVGKTGFDQFGQRIKPVAATAVQAATAIEKITPAVQKASNQAQRSTQVFASTGRVLQDLAFGPIAVANNIEPLLFSLQALAREGGGAKNIMVGLGRSLLGGGGLALGFSALTFFMSGGIDSLKKFIPGAKSATDKIKELTEEFKNAKEVIDEGFGTSQGDIATVRKLADAIQDSTVPLKNRQEALRQLQETNKSYFGDLTLEESKYGDLRKSVDEYSQAIINAAVIKGLESEISSVSQALFKQQREARRTAKDLKALTDVNKAAADSATLLAQQQNPKIRQFYYNTDNASEILKARTAAEAARKPLDTLTGLYNELTGELNNFIDANLKFKPLANPEETKKGTDALLQRISALEKLRTEVGLTRKDETELVELKIKLNLRDGLKDGFNRGEIDRINAGLEKELEGKLIANITLSTGALNDENNQLKKSLDAINTSLALNGARTGATNLGLLTKSFIELIPAMNSEAISQGSEAIKKLLTDYKTRLAELNSDKSGLDTEKVIADVKALKDGVRELNGALLEQSGIVDVLGGFFQSTFEAALVSGQNFFQSLIKGLKQLIGRLIAAAAVAAVLSAIMTGGIGAGFKGAFFGNFNKLTGFDLGSLFGGTKAPGIGRSPQAPGVAAMGNQGGEVVFRIAGQELLGVINRTNKANSYNG